MLRGTKRVWQRSVDFEACRLEKEALKDKLFLEKILLLTLKGMCAVHAYDLYDDSR